MRPGCRGNPEMEVGDIIGLQTLCAPMESNTMILVDEITFDGFYRRKR